MLTSPGFFFLKKPTCAYWYHEDPLRPLLPVQFLCHRNYLYQIYRLEIEPMSTYRLSSLNTLKVSVIVTPDRMAH